MINLLISTLDPRFVISFKFISQASILGSYNLTSNDGWSFPGVQLLFHFQRTEESRNELLHGDCFLLLYQDRMVYIHFFFQEHVFQEEAESYYRIEIKACQEYTDVSPLNFEGDYLLLTQK